MKKCGVTPHCLYRDLLTLSQVHVKGEQKFVTDCKETHILLDVLEKLGLEKLSV